MSRKTKNYNLTKPESTDFYDVEVQNGNMDIIDTELKNLNEKADSKAPITDPVFTGTPKIGEKPIATTDQIPASVTVVNSLDETVPGKALDAVQGKELAEQLTNVSNKIDNIPIATNIINGLMSKEDKTKLEGLILQGLFQDLFNAGQVVPWEYIESYSPCEGSITNEKMSSNTFMPTSGTAYAGFCTANKVDLSEFNYVKFDRGSGSSSRAGVDYYMAISNDNTASKNGEVASLLISKDGGVNAINISNLTGKYYIKVLGLSSYTTYGGTASLNVYKVILENSN
ncbi:hypothetical protein [Sinanaerobacter sp. ZZT-01]|uniref:hypothetical protein n=1 Tax=Sinanaerobacter sp. ZZT-01 TaxID=3111540 RepID=UPI002D78E0C6|nr:hypothetical protein [Sinanaerobacter sp. ZZT-01]WRR94078.1 hypothetical protein U5921_02870 [Sinanaerobacter sp. ZZT-01]